MSDMLEANYDKVVFPIRIRISWWNYHVKYVMWFIRFHSFIRNLYSFAKSVRPRLSLKSTRKPKFGMNEYTAHGHTSSAEYRPPHIYLVASVGSNLYLPWTRGFNQVIQPSHLWTSSGLLSSVCQLTYVLNKNTICFQISRSVAIKQLTLNLQIVCHIRYCFTHTKHHLFRMSTF